MGRKTVLNDAKIKSVGDSLRMGVPVEHAMKIIGHDEKSYYNWANRGEAEFKRREEGYPSQPKEDIFFRFFQIIQSAESEGMRSLIGVIQKAAHQPYEKKVTVQRFDGNRKLIDEKVTTTMEKPPWQPAAWMLERKWIQYFTRHSTTEDVTWKDKLKALLDNGLINKEELYEELGEGVGKDFFAAIGLKAKVPKGTPQIKKKKKGDITTVVKEEIEVLV